ncbi:MAG TPA: nuclear transport factor 2 family protein [Labilithrix sp.]
MKKLVLALSVLAVPVGLVACGGDNPPPAPPPPPSVTAEPPPPPPAPEPPPPAPKPSMSEMQKTTLLGMQAAFNAHDPAKVASFHSQDVVSSTPGPDGSWKDTNGRDALQQREAEFFSKVDPQMALVRVYQKGDVAVGEWIGGGSEKENPSKKVGFRAASVWWFDGDGLIKKAHMYIDEGTIAMQLGKMPGKARDVVAIPTGDAQWIPGAADDNKAVDLLKANWPTTFPKKDKKAWEASVTDDYLHEEIAMPLDWKAKKGALDEFDMLTKAVPDMSVSFENAWGFGDVAIGEFTFKGTQKGALGPIKPTNKPFALHGLEIDVFKDGKLQKATSYTNGIELAGQLGLLPKPKATPPASKK